MTQKDYLIISEPYPVVCNGESKDVIHEGLTLRMVARCGKSLQQQNENQLSWNVHDGHLSGFLHQQSCELASQPSEFLLNTSDGVLRVYVGFLHTYLREKLLQQSIVGLLVKFLHCKTNEGVTKNVYACSISNKKDIRKLLTGSNESSGLDPLRQFPVIFSSASVWTIEETKTYINSADREHEGNTLQVKKRHLLFWTRNFAEGPWGLFEILKEKNKFEWITLCCWIMTCQFFFYMEMLTTIVYLPHIEILLLFGLKKEAFVAVFDFTHLEVTTQTMSWCWESDTRLNTKCDWNNFRKYVHWPRLSQTTCPSCPFWYLMDNGKCF